MAKGRNLITDGLRGKLGGLVFVRKSIYPEHVRSARGTIKPATLNDAMQSSSARLAVANAPAKVIFDAVRWHHKDGHLWPQLIAIFRKQLKEGIPFHINDLKDLECHSEATLDKLLGSTEYKIGIAENAGRLCIDLTLLHHPDWSHLKWKEDFQYRISMVVLYPDLATGSCTKEIADGPITAFSDALNPLSFDVPVPGKATSYVAFMLATVCRNGQPETGTRVKGMRVVGLGERVVSQ